MAGIFRKHFKQWRRHRGVVATFFIFLLSMGCDGKVSQTKEFPEEIPEEDLIPPKPPKPSAPEDGTEAFCKAQRAQFHQEVWAPLFLRSCQGCHGTSGTATLRDESRFVLLPDTYPNAAQNNLNDIALLAKDTVYGTPYLLAKLSGEIRHEGGKLESKDLEQLKNWIETSGVRNTTLGNKGAVTPDCRYTVARMDARLEAVPLLDAQATFRKAAIHVAGRLPTPEENLRLQQSPGELPALLDALLEEEGFYERLKEVFNDMFVLYVRGQATFARNHFAYQFATVNGVSTYGSNIDFPRIDDLFTGDTTRARKAGLSFMEEPLELVAYIARNNHPFTEILTADYTVANPFTAYAYGFSQELPEPSASMHAWKRFVEPWVQRQGLGHTGTLTEAVVPRAGVLSTPAFLTRWTSTTSNLSRGRAEFVSKNFLATSILTFAQRPVNSTQLDNADNPTVKLQACSVCHHYMDPLSAAFTGFTYSRLASYQPHNTEWNKPHYMPGFLGETAPDTVHNTRALPWVAQHIAQDVRFPYAMVLRVFESMTGNKPLDYPAGAPHALALSAWESQNAFLHETAFRMAAQNMNIKVAFREILLSPYFRAAQTPNLPTELAIGLGEGRLLSPEMLARKIRATLGAHWGIFRATLPQQQEFASVDYNVLYGGIHPTQSPERMREMNAMMAAVASAMAREMGCRIPAWEFSKPPGERTVLTKVQIDTTPFRRNHPDGPLEASPEGERAIRENLAYLHQRLFGESVGPNSPEVDVGYALFVDVWKERENSKLKTINHSHCHGRWDLSKAAEDLSSSNSNNNNGFAALPEASRVVVDEFFSIYAWEAVLSYLLMDFRFLHE